MKQKIYSLANSRTGKFVTLAGLFAVGAWAGGIQYPWNQPLLGLADNLTGKTALTITTLGLAGTFGSMFMHGDVSHLTHKAGIATLIGGGMMGAGVVATSWGLGGALI